MHKRTFLIGMGIGIIIGALLLELFDLGEKSQKQLTEIEQQLNDPSSPTPTVSEEPLSSPLGDNAVEPESPTVPSQPSSDSPESPVVPDPPVEGEQEQSSNHNNEASQVDVEESYIIRIHYGDSITTTGNTLAEHQLIDNAEEFVAFFKSHDATIRAGFFLVERETSLAALLHLFADQPLTELEADMLIADRGIQLIR